jgi:hypothetical protein
VDAQPCLSVIKVRPVCSQRLTAKPRAEKIYASLCLREATAQTYLIIRGDYWPALSVCGELQLPFLYVCVVLQRSLIRSEQQPNLICLPKGNCRLALYVCRGGFY